ncbi:hypothetical protein MLD38_014342 [Melastoma candidum]|uniref:Uncharacterized protein n=1 Tax=Melastoma candidum TaxID=119954 RepID=A0ACB9RKW8_9MYRT|nr:hypothetical protein MLD38_014342 [Melastoma candidum]
MDPWDEPRRASSQSLFRQSEVAVLFRCLQCLPSKMTPVIPSPVSNVTLIPGTAFSTRRIFAPKRHTASKKQGTSTLTTKGFILPLLTSTRLFPNVAYITCRNRACIVSATGTDAAVEEQDSPAANEISSGTAESSSGAVEASDESSSTVDSPKVGQVKRARSSRKSEMPPIRNEDLVPGAMFTGKVKSIQPFGAFVDFGAFTDGLVHVSQLSDRFVKEVGSVVSIGQEVKVKLLEVNQETGRISLTMREGDDANKQQRRDSGSNTEKSRPPRKSNTNQGQRRDKSSPFAKGQDLKGTVKNLTRSGAFITLPEGEEGFLPSAEESDGGISNIMGSSTLQVGQEVDVRVLRVARGQVTLTMKKEEDSQELDPKLSQGIVYTASNPFALAFRSNKEIASFLNDRNVSEKPVTTIPSGGTSSSESTDFATESLATESSESSAVEIITGDDEKGVGIPESSVETTDQFSSSETHASTEVIEAEPGAALTEEPIKDEVIPEAIAADEEKSIEIPDSPAETADELSSAESPISSLSSLSESVDIASESLAQESDAVSKSLDTEISQASAESVAQEVVTAEKGESIEVPESSAETTDPISSSETETGGVVTEEPIKDEVVPEAVAAYEEKSIEIPDSPAETANELSSAESPISSLSSLTGSVDIASESLAQESDAVSKSLDTEISQASAESVAQDVVTAEKGESIEVPESPTETTDPISSSETETGGVVTEEPIKDEVVPEAVAAYEEKSIEIPDSPAETADELSSAESPISSLSSLSGSVDIASESLAQESDAVSESLDTESSESSAKPIAQEVITADKGEPIEVPESSAKTADLISSSETETGGFVTVETVEDEAVPEAVVADQEKSIEIPNSPAEIADELSSDGSPISSLSSLSGSVDIASESLSQESDAVSQSLAIESSESSTESDAQEVIPADGEEPIEVPESSAEATDPIFSSGSPVISEVVESVLETVVKDDVAAITQDLVISPDADSSIAESDDQTDDPSIESKGDEDDVVTDSQVGSAEQEVLEPVDAIETEKIEVAADHSEGNGNVPTPSVTADQANPESSKKVTAGISPALVKQLREETGAGMMDCKKALAESNGDIVKAQEFLRKKGLASAEKRAARATAEGRIGSYIHDSRIGVLVEVNCETDFVSRGDIFKELVEDLAMQVAACPQVQYLVPEDVPEDIVAKEREIEMQKEDLLSKPEQIRSKIVDGRINKRLQELALLEQPYIKNDKVIVKDWVKQTISTVGENIKVKRFVRLNLGEGLEKKSQDFAAEVAAQTKAKSDSPPKKEEPGTSVAIETVEKLPTVAVSAALVKQLREETGAGMMDCKKALSETGGDLEKAQEYLRKKGLSTADKKSSRLAAEGRIGCYIHDSRIGVLIEVNSETDFVGRSEKFKELVDDLAMQVVACPQVKYVSIEDIPEDILKKEKDLEMQREDLQSKPENKREKIVEGRVSKRLGELALLEQPFIKDDSLLVKDLVKQTVAALGENIKVRRFVRFTLGETAEDAKPDD